MNATIFNLFCFFLVAGSASAATLENVSSLEQFTPGRYTLAAGSDRRCPDIEDARLERRRVHRELRTVIDLNASLFIPLLRGDESVPAPMWPGKNCFEHTQHNVIDEGDTATVRTMVTMECEGAPSILTESAIATFGRNTISYGSGRPFEEKHGGRKALECHWTLQ